MINLTMQTPAFKSFILVQTPDKKEAQKILKANKSLTKGPVTIDELTVFKCADEQDKKNGDSLASAGIKATFLALPKPPREHIYE
jgi:hypothetical protein